MKSPIKKLSIVLNNQSSSGSLIYFAYRKSCYRWGRTKWYWDMAYDIWNIEDLPGTVSIDCEHWNLKEVVYGE